MSLHHSMSHQIRTSCYDCTALTGDNSFFYFCIFPDLSLILFHSVKHSAQYTEDHAQKHTFKNSQPHRFWFPRKKNKLPHIPLSFWSHTRISGPVWGPTQCLCHLIAEKGLGLEEQWNRSRGRASGAPGARNVNWEDCFKKALIFADAGRGLADGATQMGGQLTVRYCQQI